MCVDRVCQYSSLLFCRLCVVCVRSCLLTFLRIVEQPPLQFYTRVMQSQAWDRIDVVTFVEADHPESLNPVVAALQAKKAEGELMDNFHIHTVLYIRRSEMYQYHLSSHGRSATTALYE